VAGPNAQAPTQGDFSRDWLLLVVVWVFALVQLRVVGVEGIKSASECILREEQTI
jgi:hypothetical protein